MIFIKSYGRWSIKDINSSDLFMMVFRFPHARIALKNPAISISCFTEYLWGIHIGSNEIKSTLLTLSKISSRKSLISDFAPVNFSFLFQNELFQCLLDFNDFISFDDISCFDIIEIFMVIPHSNPAFTSLASSLNRFNEESSPCAPSFIGKMTIPSRMTRICVFLVILPSVT